MNTTTLPATRSAAGRPAWIDRTATALLPIAAVLLLWEAVARLQWIPPNLLPAPSAIAARLLEQLQTPTFQADLLVTIGRLLAGFGLSVAGGVVFGLLMSTRRGEPLIAPVVRLLAPVPKIALYPALVLLFGFEHASKVALVVADAMFPILLATFHGARAVPPRLLWAAWAAGAGPVARVSTVVLPSALPSILTGCRIGLVIACVNVFLAEMISSTDGLGHALVVAARSYRTVDMFVPLVLISAIGLLASAALQAQRRWWCAGYDD